MKKILSIFMVAVLSLNLLYQPCEANNNSAQGGVYQQNQRSNGNSQGKVGCIGKMCNFVKTAIKTVFAVAAVVVALPLVLGFGAGLVASGTARGTVSCEYKMPNRFQSEAMSDECKKNINDFLDSSKCSADLVKFFDEFAK